MKHKRLYRSRGNRMIAGVAGGIAEYFAIDPVIVRLTFVILALINGIGILAYIIAWIVVPEEPVNKPSGTSPDSVKSNTSNESSESESVTPNEQTPDSGRTIVGVILIIVGGVFLLQNILGKIVWSVLWPLILVAIGLGLVVRSLSERREEK